MTNNEKETIKIMRIEGKSYSQISTLLGINENTIKAHCRRHNLGANLKEKKVKEKEINIFCKHCGNTLIQGKRGKTKKFCSDNCRREWWKIHEAEYNRKAFYKLKCIGCGNEFESYGNKNRKFCDHECYIGYRFKKQRG